MCFVAFARVRQSRAEVQQARSGRRWRYQTRQALENDSEQGERELSEWIEVQLGTRPQRLERHGAERIAESPEAM